jgi:hypothetical protein
VLERIRVKQIFALIGDSLNPLADAVGSSSVEWIGVRHKEGAALAASGQAKLIGRLAVCAGTTGPCNTHLVAGLYEAARDHAPVHNLLLAYMIPFSITIADLRGIIVFPLMLLYTAISLTVFHGKVAATAGHY